MNNRAAAEARGGLLVFVNNDVVAHRADWLRRMAEEALRPEIGAVGAKLLDVRERIQHGGIVLGTGGLVTHAHRHFPGTAPGYLASLRATHRVSAVTAACLAVEAEKFRAVGGFDEAAFAVDFNDVDLCLRLDAAGYRTLMVPGAVLYHHEAASRRWNPEARARHDGGWRRCGRGGGPVSTPIPVSSGLRPASGDVCAAQGMGGGSFALKPYSREIIPDFRKKAAGSPLPSGRGVGVRVETAPQED